MNVARFRFLALAATAIAVLVPVGLIGYQSFLDNPFFSPGARPSLAAYAYVAGDEDFLRALRTSFILSGGMTAIAVPLGSALAFLMTRTDLPGKRLLEPWLMVPVFLSPVVLAFGYVVAVGPVGFFSIWAKSLVGAIPWNLYSLASLVLIAGLTHAPHVYLYVASALRNLDPSVEEAARVCGAGPWRIALTVSLPLVKPAILFIGSLVFLLGFEIFGLALVLGDPAGLLVLTTYLYKLTNLLGYPSYHLMAVVAIVIVLVTLPLAFLQRHLLRGARQYAVVRGKSQAFRPLPLGRSRVPAIAAILLWLSLTVAVPLSGVVLRSFVHAWGEGVVLVDALTLDNFVSLWEYPNLVRGIVNTLLIGTLGGALAVAAYSMLGLALHRWQSGWVRLADYLVMVPRALPGLVVGLAFLWVFLFVKPLAPLRGTLVSLWLAYTIVWLPYGLRLISSALYQVSPELEEAGRVSGATQGRVYRDVTLPLIRFGLLGSWLLVFMMFVREYSTGVYLLGPGTEVIGSLIVSLWGTGALDLIAALSLVEVLLLAVGLGAALRLGVKLHD
jgi:iron(III) transport system permease protein